METLKGESRLKAFRATDLFVLETLRVVRAIERADAGLARELRRSVARSGGAVVVFTAFTEGTPESRRALDAARAFLAESRYYVYLARRLGLLDRRRYRTLAARQDAALRELERGPPATETKGAAPRGAAPRG